MIVGKREGNKASSERRFTLSSVFGGPGWCTWSRVVPLTNLYRKYTLSKPDNTPLSTKPENYNYDKTTKTHTVQESVQEYTLSKPDNTPLSTKPKNYNYDKTTKTHKHTPTHTHTHTHTHTPSYRLTTIS